MTNRLILLAILSVFSMTSYGQDHQNAIEHEHDHHHHHINEIGIAFSPVYFLNEESTSMGFHIHYIRGTAHSNFNFGLGYERIFDDHQHSTIGIIAGYRIMEKLNMSISPGISFEKEEDHGVFSIHFETTYEYEYNNFHFGPALELSYDPEDIHISLGIHLGYGF